MTKHTTSSGNPTTGQFHVSSWSGGGDQKGFTRESFIRDLKKVAKKATPKN